METATFYIFIILGVIVVGFVVVIAFINKKLTDLSAPKDDSNLLMLNQTMQGMHARLDKAAEVIGGLQKDIGAFQEVGRGLRDLQDLLKSPKLRGNIGEQVLKDLLEQSIPKANFKMQHRFKSGEAVDAIIKTRNGIIPIDSKFPLENYLKSAKCETEEERQLNLKEFYKDVKKHVEAISKKYILPSEGTVDFAVMYMPSEAIFNETVNNVELYEYASQKKILFVSPNSFYYFLKIIMQALENEKIEEKAKEVLSSLRGIQQDARKFGEELSLLNKHVTNAKNTMDNVSSSYGRLGTKIETTGQLQESTLKQIEDSANNETVEK